MFSNKAACLIFCATIFCGLIFLSLAPKAQGWLPFAASSNYNLSSFNTAVGLVKSNTRNAIILTVGDSTTVGFGAGGSASYTGAKPNSYPDVLASALASLTSLSSQEVSYFGDNAITTALTNYPLYDTRFVINGASWSQSANTTIANFPWRNLAGTDTIAFTPTQAIDTCELYTFLGNGFGTITIDFDGGAAILTANTNNGGTTTLSRSISSGGVLGAHTVNVKRSAGGAIIFNGIDCYNSAIKRISIFNGGWAGVKAATLAGTSPAVNNLFSYQNAIPIFTPDLTILSVGINDWAVPTPIPAYKSDMQILINKGKSTGSVLIVTPPFSSTAIASQTTQNSYVTALRDLSQLNQVPIFYTSQINSNWANYAAANAAGLMTDTVHPSTIGYAQWGTAIAAAISPRRRKYMIANDNKPYRRRKVA